MTVEEILALAAALEPAALQLLDDGLHAIMAARATPAETEQQAVATARQVSEETVDTLEATVKAGLVK